MKRPLIQLLVAFYLLLFYSDIYAQTLRGITLETIQKNPQVLEQLSEFRASQQHLENSASNYYPKLDFDFSYRLNQSENQLDTTQNIGNIALENSYDAYEASLTLTQNLFEGFSSENRYNAAKMDNFFQAYKYVNVLDNIALDVINSYTKLFYFTELLKVSMHYLTQQKKLLYKKDLSQLHKIKIELNIEKIKLLVAENLKNIRDAKFRYRALVGRLPQFNRFRKPNFNLSVPKRLEAAQLYALRHNPELLATEFRLKALRFEKEMLKGSYYPKIDLKLSQHYQNVTQRNLYDQPDDRFVAGIYLHYNFFEGFKSDTKVQQQVSKIVQMMQKNNQKKREIIFHLDSVWQEYKALQYKQKKLKKYKNLLQKEAHFVKTFNDQAILDKDVYETEYQLVSTKYKMLFAKYKILDGMGLLVKSVVGDTRLLMSRVNLRKDIAPMEILDKEYMPKDKDRDGVSDSKDLCDNSLAFSSTQYFGCSKFGSFEDSMYSLERVAPKVKKSTPLERKKIKRTLKKVHKKLKKKKRKKHTKKRVKETAAVSEEYLKNSFIQENLIQNHRMIGDSFSNSLFEDDDLSDVSCVNVPAGYKLNKNGCAISFIMNIPSKFEDSKEQLPQKIKAKIAELAAFLDRNPDLNIQIIGYGSRTKKSNKWYNIKLSKRRAKRLKDELVKQGVFSFRISTDGKGFANPIADNATKQGRAKNRRLEIKFVRK